MQKLAARLYAIVRRVLTWDRSAQEPDVNAATAFRPKQVPRSRAQNISLRLLGGPASSRLLKTGSMIGASVGTVIVAGFTGPAVGQVGEEACAFVLQLRSPYTVERVMEQFPNDPCIPVMLTTIPSELLSRVSKAKILALPAAQLRRLPEDVLEQISSGGSSTRALPRTTRSTTPTYNPNTTSGSPY